LRRSFVLVLTALALTVAPGVAEANAGGASSVAAFTDTGNVTVKKKPGPPKGLSTQQFKKRLESTLRQAYVQTNECRGDNELFPCKVTFEWRAFRWLGTDRVCMQDVNGVPGKCLEYGTAHVAQTDLLVTLETYDTGKAVGSVAGRTTYKKYRFGWWDNGRKLVEYADGRGYTEPAPCAVLACPRRLYVIKDKLGTWRYDWGGNSMHKPLG
jgi:hypothetical protein